MIVWRSVDPKKLDPDFRADVEALLEGSPFTWYVTHGFRSLDEQRDLYRKFLAGGPRAAPPGKSAHNFGLAVDVVPDADPDTSGLQPEWDTTSPAWRWLFRAVAAHDGLKSGVSFNDATHIERANWKLFLAPAAPAA